MVLPKYLTISDDLQLLPKEGGGYLSKSDKTLEEVEYEVEDWLDEHPTHPMESMVRQWLDLTDEYRREQKRGVALELAVKQLEKGVRKCLFFKYRSKGMSMANARHEAAKNARAVTAKLLMED